MTAGLLLAPCLALLLAAGAAGQPKPDCSAYEADPQRTWLEANCADHLTKEVQHCLDAADKAVSAKAAEPAAHVRPDEEGHGGGGHDESQYDTVFVIFATLAVGAWVRMMTKGTSLPYTCVMFVVGLSFGGVGNVFNDSKLNNYLNVARMDPHLILHVFLPVLIFESAFAMQISVFKKVVFQCLILAVFGLLLASFLTSVVAQALFVRYGWDFTASFLFGTILSATDPVAVVALLKDLGASPIISTLIEGESLFNDGTAIVIFSVFKEGVLKENCAPKDWGACEFNYGRATCECPEFTCQVPSSIGEIIVAFLRISFGGVAVGAVVGIIAWQCLERVHNDALIEITITLVSAYVTFFCAEGLLMVSGVLGVVTCGLILSYFHHAISAEVEHTMHEFWEIVVYITNTLIFMLAGVIVALKAFKGITGGDIADLLILYAAINAIRGVVMVVFVWVLNRFPAKLGVGECCLVAWGGLRGAVGLALALFVQQDEEVVSDDIRSKFVFHVSGIVWLTLLVNGTTTKVVVKRFGLDAVSDRLKRSMHRRYEDLLAEMNESIIDLRHIMVYYDTNWDRLRKQTDVSANLPPHHADPYNKKGAALTLDLTPAEELEETRQLYLSAMAGSVNQQYHAGTLETQDARAINRLIENLQGRNLTDNPEDFKENIAQAADLGKVFKTASSREQAQSNPLARWWATRRHANRARAAFSLSIALAECHKLVEGRAVHHGVLGRKAIKRVVQVARQSTHEITEKASQALENQKEIAVTTKSKYAARIVLNSMDQMLGGFESLEPSDVALLRASINSKTALLASSSLRCTKATAVQMLMASSWFKAAGSATQEHILALLKDGALVEVEVPNDAKVNEHLPSFVPGEKEHVGGMVLVVSGVVAVRMGYRVRHFGAGEFLGLLEFVMPDGGGGRLFSKLRAETQARMLFIPKHVADALTEECASLRKETWRLAGMNIGDTLLPCTGERWRPPVCMRQQLKRLLQNGQVEVIQEPEVVSPDATNKLNLPDACLVMLMRGSCWEYELTADDGETTKCHRMLAPSVIPLDFKFATFTNHAAIFIVPLPEKPGDRARRHWGALRAKVKAVLLWVGLRGSQHRRNALAVALGRTPRQGNLDASYYHRGSNSDNFGLGGASLPNSKLSKRGSTKSGRFLASSLKTRQRSAGGTCTERSSVIDGGNGSMAELTSMNASMLLGSPKATHQRRAGPAWPGRQLPSGDVASPARKKFRPDPLETSATSFPQHGSSPAFPHPHRSVQEVTSPTAGARGGGGGGGGGGGFSDRVAQLQKENVLLRSEIAKAKKKEKEFGLLPSPTASSLHNMSAAGPPASLAGSSVSPTGVGMASPTGSPMRVMHQGAYDPMLAVAAGSPVGPPQLYPSYPQVAAAAASQPQQLQVNPLAAAPLPAGAGAMGSPRMMPAALGAPAAPPSFLAPAQPQRYASSPPLSMSMEQFLGSPPLSMASPSSASPRGAGKERAPLTDARFEELKAKYLTLSPSTKKGSDAASSDSPVPL